MCTTLLILTGISVAEHLCVFKPCDRALANIFSYSLGDPSVTNTSCPSTNKKIARDKRVVQYSNLTFLIARGRCLLHDSTSLYLSKLGIPPSMLEMDMSRIGTGRLLRLLKSHILGVEIPKVLYLREHLRLVGCRRLPGCASNTHGLYFDCYSLYPIYCKVFTCSASSAFLE